MRNLFQTTLTPLVYLIVLASSAMPQDEPINLGDTIVVTSKRTPITYSETSRTITIIGGEEIEKSPANNLVDLLAYAPGVEIRRLSTNGVRADLGLRGGTFQQALILIDGIKITDPQTGHHNLDLPLDLTDIKRIEIVSGSGSKLYGPNAMSGIINFITRSATNNQVRLESVLGEHRLSEQRLSIDSRTGQINHHLTTTRRVSSGFEIIPSST